MFDIILIELGYNLDFFNLICDLSFNAKLVQPTVSHYIDARTEEVYICK